MKQMLGSCNVCSDDQGFHENPLVYCDGPNCTVAVHQACYGIVNVPAGNWFCRKCEDRDHDRNIKAQCTLCPTKDGALKPTDTGGWAHVVCALYIPEVRFGDVSTMEPIETKLIPPERFKSICYICLEKQPTKASSGACMDCNKQGCGKMFHVTCAQYIGLLCEEAGSMMDNVKYCGYCDYHLKKISQEPKKKTNHLKIIPAFRPVGGHSRSTSPEKAYNKPLDTFSNSSSSSSTNLSGNASPPPWSNISPDITQRSKRIHHKSSSSAFPSSSSTTHKMFPSGAAPFTSNSLNNKIIEIESNNSVSSSSAANIPKKRLSLSHDYEETAPKKTIGPDVVNIGLNDVINSTLDRPFSASTPTNLTSGISEPSSGTKVDKHSPPDIKPHVTLTPIPMSGGSGGGGVGRRSSSAGGGGSEGLPPMLQKEISPDMTSERPPDLLAKQGKRKRLDEDMDIELSRGSRENWLGGPEEADGEEGRLMGQPQPVIKMLSQSSNWEGRGSPVDEPMKTFPGGAELTEVTKPIKRGPGRPPAKHRNGLSRDDETPKQPRKTGGKGSRGGRRGGGNSLPRVNSSNSIGVNGSYNLDENSLDDDSISTYSSTSMGRGRGRRSSPVGSRGPKPGLGRDDEGTPTLSQLMKSQNQTVDSPMAPHMFGNTLNPSSSMAQKMVDTLSEEMEVMAANTVAVGTPSPTTAYVGIPFPGSTVAINGNSAISPSSSSERPKLALEQLLERQWDQSSQFLMEQAQHLDIAQLLSCLNQLKQENRALESQVAGLVQRKEQLSLINARLNIPLSNSTNLQSVVGLNSSSPNNNHNNLHQQQQQQVVQHQQQQMQLSHVQQNHMLMNHGTPTPPKGGGGPIKTSPPQQQQFTNVQNQHEAIMAQQRQHMAATAARMGGNFGGGVHHQIQHEIQHNSRQSEGLVAHGVHSPHLQPQHHQHHPGQHVNQQQQHHQRTNHPFSSYPGQVGSPHQMHPSQGGGHSQHNFPNSNSHH